MSMYFMLQSVLSILALSAAYRMIIVSFMKGAQLDKLNSFPGNHSLVDMKDVIMMMSMYIMSRPCNVYCLSFHDALVPHERNKDYYYY